MNVVVNEFELWIWENNFLTMSLYFSVSDWRENRIDFQNRSTKSTKKNCDCVIWRTNKYTNEKNIEVKWLSHTWLGLIAFHFTFLLLTCFSHSLFPSFDYNLSSFNDDHCRIFRSSCNFHFLLCSMSSERPRDERERKRLGKEIHAGCKCIDGRRHTMASRRNAYNFQ